MHGLKPTLKDIELSLAAPEAVPLLCNEQLDSSDEDDCMDVVEPAQQAYRVVTQCSKCSLQLRLVVECSDTDIRTFQQLLLNTLKLVCPRCA
ncbi:putative E7 protein [Human papillomavirus 160]|uniref:Protein E7 n=1 Tax=Human papillomavirus 160 TaxID=2259332 RepID=M1VMS0_9PAPI|nr:putative E7 protein [Human papillomavirus 160]